MITSDGGLFALWVADLVATGAAFGAVAVLVFSRRRARAAFTLGD